MKPKCAIFFCYSFNSKLKDSKNNLMVIVRYGNFYAFVFKKCENLLANNSRINKS